MQKIILPDILDSSVKTNHKSLFLLASIMSYHPSVQRVNFNDLIVNNSVPEEFRELISGDSTLITFLSAYSEYMKSEKNNYIISSSLVKALKRTKLDIECKYLPKNFQGYIEIPNIIDPDGASFKGFFVDLTERNGTLIFSCGHVVYDENSKDYIPGHINIELKIDETIKESLSRYPYTVREVKNGELISNDYEFEFLEYMGVLFNVIVYLNNSEDIILNKNEFSKKKNKLDTQLKIFTTKTFFEVGNSYNQIKNYSVDSTLVSGHFRWQPYGKERSLVKHIYIQPHTRNYKGEL